MDIYEMVLSTLRMSTPLIFAAMGGLLCERAGVVNIALEGFILAGAFGAALATHFFGSPWLGLIVAFFLGSMIGLKYSFFAIKFKADQIVAGTAFNLFIIGFIPFLTKIIFDSTGSTPPLALDRRFTFEPTLIAWVTVGLVYYVIKHTRFGLWIQFAGEHPASLEAAGIKPNTIRFITVTIAGGVTALGGASLSLYLASSYSPLMSGGRGFMALAALIFGRWAPIPTLATCLFFGFADSLQMRLQGVPIAGVEIPVQFIQILPYLLTILALAGFIKKSQAPRYLGQ